ncbi:MAG: sensory box histidine kinase/response regulator [Cereibacter sp.]|jgi:signal transduction histidine kinase/DNA-binding NarL/FixJ family response regulator/HPt (histidine-containing phosphotransfer) domain-containing protein|nr:sensory box histidine kinase/response regulator [Cereibacter sp.]
MVIPVKLPAFLSRMTLRQRPAIDDLDALLQKPPRPGRFRGLGLALVPLLIAAVAYADYRFLVTEYQQSLAVKEQQMSNDVGDVLRQAFDAAEDPVRSLEALKRASESVEADELAAFASADGGKRVTVSKSYGWLPFDENRPALIVNDLAQAEKMPINDLSGQLRSLVAQAQRSATAVPDFLQGGVKPGEATNKDLLTVLRIARIGEVQGAFFITYSLRRIVSLPPLPGGVSISGVDLVSNGLSQSLLIGETQADKTSPTAVTVPIGAPSLRFLVQGPTEDFRTFVLRDKWESQATLVAIVLVVLLNAILNLRQIHLGRQAARSASLAAEAARQSDYQKTRFLATMSHEMRTPLNGIIGMSDLLLDSPLNATQRKNAATLLGSAQNLLALINQILDFSKIEAKQVQLDPHDTQLGDLLTNVANAVGVLAAAKRVEMVLILPINACTLVKADSMKLRQILTNLLSNSIKFTSKGSVTLEVERTMTAGGRVRFRFSVRDTGIGIEQDRIATIFEPFEQADISTTRAYGGTGLGLTITRQLVEAMGGRIEVASAVGKGSIFSFELDFDLVDDTMPLRRERCVVGIQNVLLAMLPSSRRNATLIGIQSVGGECEVLDDPALVGDTLLAAQRRGDPFDLVLVDDGTQAKAVSLLAAAQGLGKVKVGIIRSSIMGNQPVSTEEQSYAGFLLNAPHTALTLTQGISHAFHHRSFSKAAGKPEVAMRASFDGLRVLMVDDDEVNRYYGIALFEKLGCRVASASDGREAIEVFGDGERFDVIFMDCQMPVMDGLEATRELRKRMYAGTARARPIVALTANSQIEDRQACFAAGMKEFLSKPVRQPELVEVLTRLAPEAISLAPVSDPAPAVEGEQGDALALPELEWTEADMAPVAPIAATGLAEAGQLEATPPPEPVSVAEKPVPVLAPLVLATPLPPAPAGLPVPEAVVSAPQAPVATPVSPPVAAPNSVPVAVAAPAPLQAQPAIVGMERVTPKSPVPPPDPVVAAPADPAPLAIAPYTPQGEVLSVAALRDTREMLGASFTKLLQTFVDAAPTRLGSLDLDIDARNYEEVRRTAHSLKSSAKMVGALAMSNAALRLEEEARKPSPNRQEALAYSAALRLAYKGFVEKLKQLRKPGNAA